mmetsp:Transcript_4667/g.12522  ORF Transcript_4667/g.12522 Transcript_4667/m.12522 type:complete len:324 (+) Transcript_4667:316-1287(+)
MPFAFRGLRAASAGPAAAARAGLFSPTASAAGTTRRTRAHMEERRALTHCRSASVAAATKPLASTCRSTRPSLSRWRRLAASSSRPGASGPAPSPPASSWPPGRSRAQSLRSCCAARLDAPFCEQSACSFALPPLHLSAMRPAAADTSSTAAGHSRPAPSRAGAPPPCGLGPSAAGASAASRASGRQGSGSPGRCSKQMRASGRQMPSSQSLAAAAGAPAPPQPPSGAAWQVRSWWPTRRRRRGSCSGRHCRLLPSGNGARAPSRHSPVERRTSVPAASSPACASDARPRQPKKHSSLLRCAASSASSIRRAAVPAALMGNGW